MSSAFEWLKCPDCGNSTPEQFKLVERVLKYRDIMPAEDDALLYAKDRGETDDDDDPAPFLECQADNPKNKNDCCFGHIDVPQGHPFWENMEWA